MLRAERPSDHAAVEHLQRLAFDATDDLPSLVAALRQSAGSLPTVSKVATDGDRVVRGFERADRRGFRVLGPRLRGAA